MAPFRSPVRLLLVLVAGLCTACGAESGDGVRRGCAPGHDAAGTYRFSPGYLERRLLLLEESLRIEERAFDGEALAAFVAGMRRAWQGATLVLAPDGTFTLDGVAHPEFASRWRGSWEVRLDARECKLLLRGSGQELYALLGDGWTIPWAETPQPGVVLDILLSRGDEPAGERRPPR